MFRSISARFLAGLLVMALAAGSVAAAPLEAIRVYSGAGFSDVPDDWSRPYIVTCYELGLMSGQGDGRFHPGGTVSLAEGLTVAARIHDLWRGGAGDLPAGEPWYAGAVTYGLEHGLVAEGEFPDYTAPATRAQLAGLLARALPAEDRAPINAVSALPDVNAATPYAESIFALYNAGVLTGGDAYGTFTPNASITRAELAAILCRLVQPDTRVTLTLQEAPPKDAMAYTTDKLLWLGNVPAAGMVVVEGEYYFPLELLDFYSRESPIQYSGYDEDQPYTLSTNRWAYADGDEVTLMAPVITAKAGQPIGMTQVSPRGVQLPSSVVKNAVRTLDGRYPMIRLSDLAQDFGYREDDTSVIVGTDLVADLTVTWEADLAGQAAASLAKETTRDTLQAFHDYLVNTLTHMDGMDYAYWEKNDPDRYARGEELGEKYHYGTNFHLAWGYGVCQDYAELFQAMCVQSGIPCQLVSGAPDHAWNRVYVDGEWRYMDVTWDDPLTSTPTLRQNYFLVDAQVMAQGHWWDGDDYPMPAEYDPAWEQLDPNNITSADMFRKCLVAQMMQRQTFIRLRTTAAGSYGGTGCIYAYPTGWYQMGGGYNSATGTYDYTVEYW